MFPHYIIYAFLADPESPVIFARSFLLEGSTNTMFACKTEVKK